MRRVFATIMLMVAIWPSRGFAGKADLTVKSPLGTALSGTPVVVELTYSNRGDSSVVIVEPIDPFLAFTSWKWESSANAVYLVTLADLHFTILPEPARPRELTLAPGESQIWHATVPTPARFAPTESWTLAVTVLKNFERESETRKIAFRCRDPEVACGAERIGPTLAQAAVLEFPRRDVIQRLVKEGKFESLEDCSRKGDRLADLILYSRAVFNKHDIAQHWRGLENAAEEIKCLRNYLLFYPLQYVPGTLSDEDADAIAASLTPQSPFRAELIERIKNRRR